jgi:hypothetical protein
MAASTTVFSTTPLIGLKLGATGVSTPAFPLLTRVIGSDGHDYMYVQANEALGSIDTVLVAATGSCSSDAGSAGWTLNVPGGLTAAQYGFAKRTSVNS